MSDFKRLVGIQNAARRQKLKVVTPEEAERTPYDPIKDGPRLVVPTEQEVKAYTENRTCGDCAHFRHRLAQEEMAKSRTWNELFDKQGYNHNGMWYGDLRMFGLCEQWEGHLAHAMATCKIPAHLLDSSLATPDPVTHGPRANKDDPIDCPYFRKGGSFRKTLKLFMGGGRSYDPN